MQQYVYLLHFSQPIGNRNNPRGQAQHYIGSTTNLDQRLRLHRQGNSQASKLCAHAASIGVSFTLAEVWLGGFDLERALKRRKRASDFCPLCQRTSFSN